MSSSLHVTHSAADKIFNLMQEESEACAGLRVYITGGGCSGFQYGFAFAEEVEDDDIEVVAKTSAAEDANQAALLVDTMSFQYLKDAEIDYVEDVEGARFVIRNPNAKTTCGCGSSFSV